MGVYRYFSKEGRKNPHWSFSCCLALLLPLTDLQGKMSGLAETDVLTSQLKSGDMEMATILVAEENSGDADVQPDESGNGRDELEKGGRYDTTATHLCKFQHVKFNSNCNQGAQTELLTLYPINPSMMLWQASQFQRTD